MRGRWEGRRRLRGIRQESVGRIMSLFDYVLDAKMSLGVLQPRSSFALFDDHWDLHGYDEYYDDKL